MLDSAERGAVAVLSQRDAGYSSLQECPRADPPQALGNSSTADEPADEPGQSASPDRINHVADPAQLYHSRRRQTERKKGELGLLLTGCIWLPQWASDSSVPAGVSWTEEEHRSFLAGLQALGRVRPALFRPCLPCSLWD